MSGSALFSTGAETKCAPAVRPEREVIALRAILETAVVSGFWDVPAKLQLLLKPLKGLLVFVGDFPAEAGLFDRFVLGARLEGFVAKRLASTYKPGVISRDWIKIKRPGWQEGRTWRK
ncbi:MAG TPA: hypothetical protein VLK85_07660 [Ramlibacter sp.]|nr:hypothetical protein [Ramlibacter sp.]